MCQTLLLSQWGNKAQSTNKQDEWINGQLIRTSRTMGDYRNSPTIKFGAELFLAHRCPSILERASENWSNLLTSKASVTFCQINWTVCKRWKRNSEKFQLPIKCFLMVDNNLQTENVFRSKLCKSNWNSAWNLAFPVFTLVYIVRNVWKSSLWIGMRYTTTKNTIDRQHAERGKL